jgi:hypothetical protein
VGIILSACFVLLLGISYILISLYGFAKVFSIGVFAPPEVLDMSTRQDRQQIQQLKSELKFAQETHASRLRDRDLRLLKLAMIMVILAMVAGFIYGRIQI